MKRAATNNQVPAPLPLRWRRLWLLVISLGLLFCMWQAAQLAREQALSNLQDEAENELRLSAANLNGYLLRYDYLPQMLATREGVQRFLASPNSQDPMPLNMLLDRFRFTADVSDVYLLNRDGDTIAASNWHRPNTFIGQNYAFRSYYTDAIAGGQGRFFGLGIKSLERGYYFSSPVWLDDTSPDSRPDGVLVVKVLLDDVEESWAEQDAELFVTDSDNIIFMASHPELRMNALYPLTDEQRQTLRDTRRYAMEPLTPSGIEINAPYGLGSQLVSFSQGPLSGGDYLSLTRPIPEFGWQMHILKPLTPVISAQWIAALMAGGLYGMVALGAGIGWQRLRLRREREAFADRERNTLARVRDELEVSVERRTRDLVASNQRLSDEIEERRRAEANLRQTQDELIQAAKLAVLGQLAAGINHELNQPLAAIRAYAENARRFMALARHEKADANLEQIVELTERMADISAQLRQFSRKSSERQETISVQACIDYALRLFQSRIREGNITIIQNWPDETLWVKGDLVRLEQVLVNLIGNALQAMKAVPAPQLTLGAHTHQHQVIISVTDSGPGIPEEHLGHIFEPFFTTKAPGSGLGLGLSISSRIMDDLGGKLQAANQAGGEPASPLRYLTQHLLKPRSTPTMHEPSTLPVMVIDDEPHLRITASQTLELAGYTPYCFESAEQALAALTPNFPGVIVSDIRMPGMDGMSLLHELHNRDATLPIILITGHGDISTAVEAMRAGAWDFLEKPFAGDQLLDVVRRGIEKRQLSLENHRLKAELEVQQAALGPRLVGRTPIISRLAAMIQRISQVEADVLLFGETGTGKDLVARAIHERSARRNSPFMAINCGAVPENTIESELFGHEKGAFTGAVERRIGKFEHANGGTVFLDEIESMPMALQVKLLRVLQERSVERLGANETVPLDIRVIAATKVDLKAASEEGNFREDLYYRLNVVTLPLPALRERREDIPLLFQHFAVVAANRSGLEAPTLDSPAIAALLAHDWPGNVRELRNLAERYVLLGAAFDYRLDALLEGANADTEEPTLPRQVELFEKSLISQSLARYHGRVTDVCRHLGIPRKTFYDKLKKHGLNADDYRHSSEP